MPLFFLLLALSHKISYLLNHQVTCFSLLAHLLFSQAQIFDFGPIRTSPLVHYRTKCISFITPIILFAFLWFSTHNHHKLFGEALNVSKVLKLLFSTPLTQFADLSLRFQAKGFNYEALIHSMSGCQWLICSCSAQAVTFQVSYLERKFLPANHVFMNLFKIVLILTFALIRQEVDNPTVFKSTNVLKNF